MIAEGFFPTLIYAEDVNLNTQQLANDIVMWSKKDKGLEPIFFEKIGDKNTSRDEMKENLIKALKKNGWTLKK